MDKLYKFEIHEGEDYFRISQLCSTNDDEKYSMEVGKETGRLIISQLNALQTYIKSRNI